MARILLVRHGETKWNREGLFQGQSDISLSPEGMRQAERLRERLASEKINVIYSSDLKRALDTAKIIGSSHNVEVKSFAELKEINFGEIEGKTFEQIKEHAGILEEIYVTGNPEISPPGGESLNQLANRVAKFIPELHKHSAEETILVVAHGGTLRVLLGILLGKRLEEWLNFPLDIASLSIVEVSSEKTKLLLLNDRSHL